RLIQFFLPEGSGKPEWVSTELRTPAVLTVATYQALHALCSGESEQKEPIDGEENGEAKNHQGDSPNNGTDVDRSHVGLPKVLSEAAFEGLVLDEAHHLRAEWWRSLTSV